MSRQVSNIFKTEFDAQVKHVYQGMRELGDAVVDRRAGVGAKTYQFNFMGKGLAQKRLPQTDLVPMNINHEPRIATIEDWSAPEFLAKEDLEKLPVDVRGDYVKAVAMALGRRSDQIIIDAFTLGANTTIVPAGLQPDGTSGVDVGLHTTKLRRVKRLMDSSGVPKQDRYFGLTAAGLEDLLGTTEATSSDFNTVRALVNGEIDTWLGFKFITLDAREEEGGLPIDGGTNIRTNFAWHKESTGFVLSSDMATEIDWLPGKYSWQIHGHMSAGAIAIDDGGIYSVESLEVAL